MACKPEIVEAYAAIAEHTRPRCAKCPTINPDRCCPFSYCEDARQFAADQGIALVDTGHPRLPFMGESGCIVPLHLRPICAVHECQIRSLGFDPHDLQWTDEYFRLRDRCAEVDDRFDVEDLAQKLVYT